MSTDSRLTDRDVMRGIVDRVRNSRQDYQSASEGDFSNAEVAVLIADSELLISLYRSMSNRIADAKRITSFADAAIRELIEVVCNRCGVDAPLPCSRHEEMFKGYTDALADPFRTAPQK